MNKRVGIIGLGFGAQVHLPAFASEGWEVAAVCSRTRDKARAAADAAGVKDVHTDPAELFARTDIDAVAISTPPATHHPLSIAALNAGKHVVCEKPFAMSAERAQNARCGRTHEAHGNGRARVPVRAAAPSHQAAAARRYIGRFNLCTIELFLDRYVDARSRAADVAARQGEGGGILGALGSHYIDGLRDWFGEVASVQCSLSALRPDVLDGESARSCRPKPTIRSRSR
jgi:predicted dehydrogenase